jgi:hypothetical protein
MSRAVLRYRILTLLFVVTCLGLLLGVGGAERVQRTLAIRHLREKGAIVETVDHHLLYQNVVSIDFQGMKRDGYFWRVKAVDVTDSDLRWLRFFPELRRLDLSCTRITDEGLHVIDGLGNLESLALNNTAVTDTGLHHLRNVPTLQRLALGDILQSSLLTSIAPGTSVELTGRSPSMTGISTSTLASFC